MPRFSRRCRGRLLALTVDGQLPPGLWPCAWDELVLGQNELRQRLIPGLQAVLNPVDVDLCHDHRGVALSVLDPILLPAPDARVAQRTRYGCEVFVAQMIEAESGRTFLEFFRQRKDGRGRKGPIELDPREAP